MANYTTYEDYQAALDRGETDADLVNVWGQSMTKPTTDGTPSYLSGGAPGTSVMQPDVDLTKTGMTNEEIKDYMIEQQTPEPGQQTTIAPVVQPGQEVGTEILPSTNPLAMENVKQGIQGSFGEGATYKSPVDYTEEEWASMLASGDAYDVLPGGARRKALSSTQQEFAQEEENLQNLVANEEQVQRDLRKYGGGTSGGGLTEEETELWGEPEKITWSNYDPSTGLSGISEDTPKPRANTATDWLIYDPVTGRTNEAGTSKKFRSLFGAAADLVMDEDLTKGYGELAFMGGGEVGSRDPRYQKYKEQLADAQMSQMAQQRGMLNLATSMARGETPSAAEMQMRQGMDRQLAAQRALAASGGGDPALARRAAALGSQQAMAQTQQQTAMLRAQEQQQQMQMAQQIQGQMDQTTQSYMQMGMSLDEAQRAALQTVQNNLISIDEARINRNLQLMNSILGGEYGIAQAGVGAQAGLQQSIIGGALSAGGTLLAGLIPGSKDGK